jgi:hypothetical protein
MAEDSAFARHGFKGGAKETTVPAGLGAGATSLTATDLSTWAGVATNGPFFFVIDDGLTGEEVCQATGLSGNIISGITRGLRGTSDVTHATNARIKHVSTDRDFDEANRLVNAILGISGLAAGDLLYLLSATTFARLAKGTARQALGMNAGATAPTYMESLQSLLTASGDTLNASAANTPARLAKGTARQALLMDAAAGVPTWGDSLASLLTTQGDMPYASGANTPARLAKGTALQQLRMNSGATAPEWASSIYNILTSKGDLLGASAANTPVRKAVGSNQQRLIADSAEATGLRWGFDGPPVFADATARDAAITVPTTKDWAWLADTGTLTHYTGSAWIEWGTEGAWTSYTPTLTQSSAIAKTVDYSRYTRRGRLITWQALVSPTAVGSAGSQINLTLPVTAAPGVAEVPIGNFYFFDNSTSTWHSGPALLNASNTLVRGISAGAVGYMGVVSPNAALAVGDMVGVNATYEAAS